MATTRRVSPAAHLSWLNGSLDRIEPTLKRGEHGGYYMMVPCEMGERHHHYVAPDPTDARRVVWSMTAYEWPTPNAAYDAVEQLKAQK